MLGYPLDPKLKRYAAESAAYSDERLARLVNPNDSIIGTLPKSLPYEHDWKTYTNIGQSPDKNFNNKLKVGFVASGFSSKAVLYLSHDMFRFYDRTKIEMHVFSMGPPDNPQFIQHAMKGVDWRQRVINHVDAFHNVFEMMEQNTIRNTMGLAQYIKKQNIHILIEWDGYARQGSRAEGLMALRPAPIQLLHQEYLGTSGSKHVDYITTDVVTTPSFVAQEGLWTEKFIYLPNHFFSKGHAVQKEVHEPNLKWESKDQPWYVLGKGTPQENKCLSTNQNVSFVYCNFNKFLKNNPETMRSWMDILYSVPDSILCLLENPRDGVKYLRRFVTTESKGGEDLNERVHFLSWEGNPFIHQRRNYDFCNVMLDSYPYNGHTVAQDALYAGVPIVTRSDGLDMSSRVTTSANVVLGLDKELNSPDGVLQYIANAVELGLNRDSYNYVRQRLMETIKKRNPMHPYWDVPRYMRNFEQGLWEAWTLFINGEKPRHIFVMESNETAKGTFDDLLRAHPSDGMVVRDDYDVKNKKKKDSVGNDEL